MTDWYADDDRFEPAYEADPDDDESVVPIKGVRRAQRVENRQKMRVTGRSVFLIRQLAARPKRRRRARAR